MASSLKGMKKSRFRIEWTGGEGGIGGRAPRTGGKGGRKDKKGALTLGNLFLNTSILFKNKIILVRRNHLLLITLSNSTNDSAIRFCE